MEPSILCVDPDGDVRAETVNTLGQAADGTIELRESDDADYELRTRGLSAHPGEWRPFTLP